MATELSTNTICMVHMSGTLEVISMFAFKNFCMLTLHSHHFEISRNRTEHCAIALTHARSIQHTYRALFQEVEIQFFGTTVLVGKIRYDWCVTHTHALTCASVNTLLCSWVVRVKCAETVLSPVYVGIDWVDLNRSMCCKL
jgi:hypothetical protein